MIMIMIMMPMMMVTMVMVMMNDDYDGQPNVDNCGGIGEAVKDSSEKPTYICGNSVDRSTPKKEVFGKN